MVVGKGMDSSILFGKSGQVNGVKFFIVGNEHPKTGCRIEADHYSDSHWNCWLIGKENAASSSQRSSIFSDPEAIHTYLSNNFRFLPPIFNFASSTWDHSKPNHLPAPRFKTEVTRQTPQPHTSNKTPPLLTVLISNNIIHQHQHQLYVAAITIAFAEQTQRIGCRGQKDEVSIFLELLNTFVYFVFPFSIRATTYWMHCVGTSKRCIVYNTS